MIWWIYLLLLPLLAYALWLFKAMQTQRRVRLQSSLQQQQKRQQQRQFIVDSLDILCQEFLHNNLNPSETCIRLKVLVDNLALPSDERQQFAMLDRFYQPLAAFATHQQRSQLAAAELARQDAERETLEQQFAQELTHLAEALQQRHVPQWRQHWQLPKTA